MKKSKFKEDTCGVKYIGSKKKLLSFIGDIVNPLDIKTAVDVFSGTTRVAQYLRSLGIKTDTSDLSWATTAYAHCLVHNKSNAHLQTHIDAMNKLTGVQGWLSDNYAGTVPQTDDAVEGRCFQLKNAMKADAARDYIDALSLDPWEKYTLITSVIFALDCVDNTVGVQQAYLKKWCARSHNDIVFKLPISNTGPTGTHFEGSCLSIKYNKYDLAYFDPPYSPHSYSTYYHIWDSIVKWDKPATSLKAKRRIDRVAKNKDFDPSMESPWNSKNKAVDATRSLLKRIDSKYFLFSYSNESLIAEDALFNLLKEFGEITATEVDYRRNIMSQIGNAKDDAKKNQQNKEFLILVKTP
jgi:adenine-specific DNA-methyltransferase